MLVNFNERRKEKLLLELSNYIQETTELLDYYQLEKEQINILSGNKEIYLENLRELGTKIESQGIDLCYFMTKIQIELYKKGKKEENNADDFIFKSFIETKREEIDKNELSDLENLVKAFGEVFTVLPMLDELDLIDNIVFEQMDGMTGVFNYFEEESYIFLAPQQPYEELLLTIAHIYGSYIYHANIYSEDYATVYEEIYEEYKKELKKHKGIDISEEKYSHIDSQSEIMGLMYQMYLQSNRGKAFEGDYMIPENSYNRLYNKYIGIILGNV